MEIAAFAVAVVALIVAGASATFTLRAARANETEAKAALRAEWRAERPELEVGLVRSSTETDPHAAFSIRNDGPIDLDSIEVLRPSTDDGVRYPVACMGGGFEDVARFGAVPMGGAVQFVLAVGTGPRVPEFRVRVIARRGDDTWERVVLLEKARQLAPRVVFPSS